MPPATWVRRERKCLRKSELNVDTKNETVLFPGRCFVKVIQIAPSLLAGRGSVGREEKQHGIHQEPPKTQATTPEMCPVPQMSGLITQTPTPTLSGGVGRTITTRKPSPTQPKNSKKHRNIPRRKTPTRKLGNRKKKMENQPPKSRETARKKNIECSREVKISCPRRRLEIHLRYARHPVQTR